MSDKKKKIKKKIDANDFDGKPVEPLGKKDKKLDLTDELKLFAESEITLNSIKRIFLRMNGPTSEEMVSKSKIQIYALPIESKYYPSSDYIIILTHRGINEKYHLTSMGLYKLGYFGGDKKRINSSHLKDRVVCMIYSWLAENHDKITVLD